MRYLKTLASAVVLLLAVPLQAAPQMTDSNISDTIEDELLFDTAVPSYRIDIETTDGIVELTGSVDSLLAKERAARIAETVKGVRAVTNRIEVRPAQRVSDTRLQQRVQKALLVDPATETYEVAAQVEDGEVTLSGEVNSWAEKNLAGTVVKAVHGVTGLNNELSVIYTTERADSEIQTEIDKKLQWNVLVDDGLIDVAVEDGEVTLSGTVGSAAEKTQARLASWVAGVTSIEDENLEVARWARDEDLRQEKYVSKTDAEIKQAINDALLYDPRTLSFKIRPEAVGGMVTLRGTVDNAKAKRAAESIAGNTVGVVSVQNRIKVRPDDEVSDEALEQEVADALLRDPYADRFDITVDVRNGVAYLYGDVDTYFERGQADDAASRVAGVIAVINHLDVDYDNVAETYDPYVDRWSIHDYDWYDYEPSYTSTEDVQITSEIQDELWWSPFVDADQVSVSVENGTATLTGVVDSLSEKRAAAENAIEGGATSVSNQLVVN